MRVPKFLFAPRVLLRAVRALERIATSLESLRDGFYRAHHLSLGTPITEVDDDTDPDDTISYASDRTSYDTEQRAAAKRSRGFPVHPDDLAAGA